MNFLRRKFKKQRIVQHRQERYLHAINKVIDGEADPEYATQRWGKLQEAKGNNRKTEWEDAVCPICKRTYKHHPAFRPSTCGDYQCIRAFLHPELKGANRA